MKFDKETIIVVMVCIVLITLCNIFLAPDRPQPTAKKQTVEKTADVKPAEATTEKDGKATEKAAEQKVEQKDGKADKTVEQKAELNAAAAAPETTLENDHTIFYFNGNGILTKIVSKKIKKTKSDSLITFNEFPGNEPFTFDIEGWTFKSAKVVKNSDTQATVYQTFENGEDSITVKKVFTISKAKNTLDCVFSFSGSVQKLPKVVVWSGTITPLKQFSNDELRDIHQAEYMVAADRDVETADPNEKKQEKYLKKSTGEPVKWVAVSNKYFLSQLYIDKTFNGGCTLVNHKDNNYSEPGIAGILLDVPADTEYKLSFYAGSKALAHISKLPDDAQEAIHLAYWSWFEFLCRPMLALLNWLKSFSGSYGLAIILLTIIVKLVLWPLIHKGNKSMRKMTKIQPKLQELKEKYKDNPQVFNQKMMELYREEKVNPLGGCLPMLLQFPVFIALYSTLEAAVELRNVPFLWAKDLSQPDAIGPEIWGFTLHPLILISTGLMILQMKLTPQGGDPMQRKIMLFMPLIMLIFFYNFPSGLALYWTVNNILSILQMKYSQYAAQKEEERANSSTAKAA